MGAGVSAWSTLSSSMVPSATWVSLSLISDLLISVSVDGSGVGVAVGSGVGVAVGSTVGAGVAVSTGTEVSTVALVSLLPPQPTKAIDSSAINNIKRFFILVILLIYQNYCTISHSKIQGI